MSELTGGSLTFQSTLPARGATKDFLRKKQQVDISIHAPRTGSDVRCCQISRINKYFNPRSPHGERRITAHCRLCRCTHFNPRSPHGERRKKSSWRKSVRQDFNPRSPHGERRAGNVVRSQPRQISIHAPRTGSDEALDIATERLKISIHAPRTGSDFPRPLCFCKSSNFNPRSPHGERRSK